MRGGNPSIVRRILNSSTSSSARALRIFWLSNSSRALSNSASTSVWVNAILSTEFVKGIEQWFTRFNVNKDIYDSAIDSVYNATHVGGSQLHHIVVGQHTIWGAFKAAKDALLHAWTYSYRDRKVRKRTFRQLWQTHISSASKAQGISYSKFIKALKDNKIELDRKILADLAENNPEIFQKIIEYDV